MHAAPVAELYGRCSRPGLQRLITHQVRATRLVVLFQLITCLRVRGLLWL